jgi:RecA/RadA recombinase
MAGNKWVKKLMDLDGAVTLGGDVHREVLTTGSPSTNFIFGNGQGLPPGFTALLAGQPKAGKTIICNSFVSQLHANFPDAIAVKFDTEYRSTGQLTPSQLAAFGIDLDRYVPYEVNEPAMIFDRIETEVASMIQEGAPVKLIIVDSLNSIQGRRAMNQDTIMTQQIGDLALTLGDGLKRILPVIRKYRIGLVLTCQVRAEMDIGEQMRSGSKIRAAVPFAVGHFAEYNIMVDRNRTKTGDADLLGADLRDESVNSNMSVSSKENVGEKTAHRIRVKMVDSSMGPKGRTGEFTFSYTKGIINIHEEIFMLGVARKLIERPNNLSYVFRERRWTGKPAILDALAREPELQKEIMNEVRRLDLAGVPDPEPVPAGE